MTRYIEQLNECTDPTTGDFLWVVDASAGATDKDRKVNASRFAILANAQTFTTTQTFAPTSTSVEGILINMPTSTVFQAIKINHNGTQRQQAYTDSATNRYWLLAMDGGTGTGTYFIAGRNTNASTPAAGFFQSENRAGTIYYQWVDASGNLRVGTTAPTNAQDSSGTVVGTQTSSLDSKNVLGKFTDYEAALQAIVAAPLYDFTYKSGSFNGERFTGIITDYSPLFGMDRDEAHPSGKSLNEVTAHGYAMAAIKALHSKIEALETQVVELQSR